MKKVYFLPFLIIAAMLSSCGKGGQGELVGAYNKKFKNKKIPLGMVYIPSGATPLGGSDEDITFSQNKPSTMATISAFFMDQTEISNAEYRQFVNWVRDSIAVTTIGQSAPELFITPKNQPKGASTTGQKNINWKRVGNGSMLWSNKKGGKYAAKLENMYYTGLDALPGRKEVDVRKLEYVYSIINLDKAAINHNNPNKTRQDNIDNYKVKVYPDTLVWKLDYSYSQNDPLVKSYFNHPSYDNYPVVGITWEQASAFCVWRTRFYESVASARRLPINSRLDYALPTDAQFEYAARGGNVKTKYPWGGPYIRNAKGCLMANFKPGRGDYSTDGGIYTVGVKSYYPNDYGLYNMAGNVSEWTITAYNKSAGPLVHDLNPNFTLDASAHTLNPVTGTKVAKANKYLTRKVVKGGSWKDMGFFLQNAIATYEYQDQPRSYIGFRCVSAFPGRDIRD